MPALWNFQKADLKPCPYSNTPLFPFPYWGTRFKYLPEGCPYMLMYSALHIMQWFSQLLDVFTPKIRRKFFDFNIFMNQNKRRLHKTLKWSLNNVVRFKYHRRQTDLLLCTILLLPPLKSPSKHGRWRSSLLLYSISMCNTWSSLGQYHDLGLGDIICYQPQNIQYHMNTHSVNPAYFVTFLSWPHQVFLTGKQPLHHVFSSLQLDQTWCGEVCNVG